MKFFAIFLFLLPFNAFTQESEILRIDSLLSKGIQLNKGWKFHTGDNPEWAKPGFDDSDWDTTSPATQFDKFPKLTEAQIGWFRLSIAIDSPFINQPLILTVNPKSALEIYLNGKLVRNIGKVSKDPSIEKAYADNSHFVSLVFSHPVNFVFSHTGKNVIAVRYSLTKSNFSPYQSPFSLSIQRLERYVDDQKALTNGLIVVPALLTGFYFMLAIFHLNFFIFYPLRRVHLLFGLALLLSAISNLIELSSQTLPTGLSFFNAKIIATEILGITSLILLLAAVYRYLHRPFAVFFWCLTGLYSALVVLYSVSFVKKFWDLDLIAGVLLIGMFFNYMYVSYRALKKKNKSAKILFFGGLFFLTPGLVYLILEIFYTKFGQADDLLPILELISMLAFPVTISLVFARDFAQTSYSLKKNLDEVKRLSAEKEQILSTQNEMLEKQVQQRTTELKQSLENLKSAQAQLIQSEKMASLGELTAGIAHEIQNPLNFVNNFSEVNGELLEELKTEIATGNQPQATLIADDIKQNLEKINHHGKRADAIVKGMLQHSRKSEGKKEPTNINALCDEYLRLAYHGFRAKDKNFNVDFKTDCDESIGKINIVPQDIGRALFNLFNNAFYALTEKKKTADEDYQPTILVQTKKIDDKVEVTVKDNGNGIPQKVIDKIFQPFFTTKPTGQGTGLGLSLAYDIIKAHGGEIKVETKESEGAEFIIYLPV